MIKQFKSANKASNLCVTHSQTFVMVSIVGQVLCNSYSLVTMIFPNSAFIARHHWLACKVHIGFCKHPEISNRDRLKTWLPSQLDTSVKSRFQTMMLSSTDFKKQNGVPMKPPSQENNAPMLSMKIVTM